MAEEFPEENNLHRAVYGGSFDPPTIGHEHVIGQGSHLFDELHVAVAVNPAKNPRFSVEERVGMLGRIADRYDNVTVGHYQGVFTAHYAAEHGYTHLLRGLRNIVDFQKEYEESIINKELAPSVETVTVLCPPELAVISSSLIKGLIGPRGWEDVVRPKVSDFVFDALQQHFEASKA